MSVYGVSNQTNTDIYSNYKAASSSQPKAEKQTSTTTQDSAAVYESSKNTQDTVKKTYTPNTALVNKMKADAEARTSQLQGLVDKLLKEQGNAYGQANDIWKLLSGGKLKVDAATKLQAQKDIAEDGYYGVEQTSSRIVDFAKALTGGDPDKIEEMRAAFEKGYKMATKTWGKELPDISSRTYDAVMRKFDAWKEESANANSANNTSVV